VIRSSPSFCLNWIMPRLGSFSRQHPETELRLRGELFGMSAARMHAEAIDVIVLYGKMPDQTDQLVIPLMAEYLVPVATPAYLQQHAPLSAPADVAAHTLLHDDSPWEEAPPFAEWCEWLRVAGQGSPAAEEAGRHGHQYNLSHLAINGALLGQGLAMARASLVHEELGRGVLTAALPLAVRSVAGYWLVMSQSAARKASAQVFKEWIVTECRSFEAQRTALLAGLSIAE
jgi:DNA-binding transcriptional LysR family regulator